MTTLNPTAIANSVAAECLLVVAEKEARERAHTWREATGTGVSCIPLPEGRVLVVTHAYAPYADGYGYCVAERSGDTLQMERDEAVAYLEGCWQ